MSEWIANNDQLPDVVTSTNYHQFEDNFEEQNMRTPLPDSDKYIRSLESKLSKVQGRNRDLTAKDIIRSLEKVKLSAMENLMNESQADCQARINHEDMDGQTTMMDTTTTTTTTNNNNNTSFSHNHNNSGGGHQAVDEDELKRLVEFDLLQKITQLTEQ